MIKNKLPQIVVVQGMKPYVSSQVESAPSDADRGLSTRYWGLSPSESRSDGVELGTDREWTATMERRDSERKKSKWFSLVAMVEGSSE